MKLIIRILSLCLVFGTAASAQTESVSPAITTAESVATTPVMTLESTEVDYGVIQQNAEPYREFPFTNTGDAPLVIANAKGSCGCTIPEWPKEPIAPGESSVIKVKYATNRIGKFSKTITLTTNESVEKRVLRIKGEVLKPAPDGDVTASPEGEK